mmetsp:Transcript_53257/g.169153  ORF Transcript_53257/g.169153 Transcript_53257/m.169153 type:complete len:220 (-) Transcript_53257:1722-2381(-)
MICRVSSVHVHAHVPPRHSEELGDVDLEELVDVGDVADDDGALARAREDVRASKAPRAEDPRVSEPHVHGRVEEPQHEANNHLPNVVVSPRLPARTVSSQCLGEEAERRDLESDRYENVDRGGHQGLPPLTDVVRPPLPLRHQGRVHMRPVEGVGGAPGRGGGVLTKADGGGVAGDEHVPHLGQHADIIQGNHVRIHSEHVHALLPLQLQRVDVDHVHE